jgi:hypothetical protein
VFYIPGPTDQHNEKLFFEKHWSFLNEVIRIQPVEFLAEEESGIQIFVQNMTNKIFVISSQRNA